MTAINVTLTLSAVLAYLYGRWQYRRGLTHGRDHQNQLAAMRGGDL